MDSRVGACVFANLKFCGVSAGTHDTPPSSPFTRRTTLNFRKHKMRLSVFPAWQTISHKFTLNYNQQCVQMHWGSGRDWQGRGFLPNLWLGLVLCHLFGKPENVFQTRIGPFCKRATEWGSTPDPVSLITEQTHNRNDIRPTTQRTPKTFRLTLLLFS